MYLHVWAGLQQVGCNTSYVSMTQDILAIRQTVRNMVRRRNQVRFCNALPLSISSSAEGAGVFAVSSFWDISRFNHQGGGLSQPMFQ